MAEPPLPIYIEYLYPVLEALAGRQDSARIDEVFEDVISLMNLTPAQVEVMYPATAQAKGSKVVHRIRFALTWLKKLGAVDNSSRGVWTLTPAGRDLLTQGDAAVRDAYGEMKKRQVAAAAERKAGVESPRETPEPTAADDESVIAGEASSDQWKADLIAILEALPPAAFERLCARLLREAGCSDVRVTGRAGDEGLDGVATLHVSLLSFPVYFQAKRYRSSQSIGPDKVRELRGALAGRGDKGILITTGFFTSAALEEARRAGAPIDLIDGEQLCDLLLEYNLGVERRPVAISEFFDSL